MKSTGKRWLLFLGVAFSLMNCQQPVKGTQIKGEVSDAANLQVFLDRIVFNQPTEALEKITADARGNFQFDFPEGITPGIYNIRIGAKRLNVVFDGTEKVVTIKGDLSSFQDYTTTIEGSAVAATTVQTTAKMLRREIAVGDLQTFIDTTASPMAAALIAYKGLGPNGRLLEVHQNAYDRLAEAMPDDALTKEYNRFIQAIERQYKAQMASERIKVGEPAPDIQLEDPSGKEYALSDLKGKVVLVDFWASWCRPCRAENPNVVKVYNKYKDQGFTIFSVSLDGIDSRMRQRLGNESAIEEKLEREREKWVNAIQADGLSWDYHVSDLRKWESEAAQTYGVRGIPRTFLVDREGKIAEIGLRGAANIEKALQEYL